MSVSEIKDGLYISDIHHVMNEDIAALYDIVITVCRNEPDVSEDCPVAHQQFGLWDRDVEQYDTFTRAVDATIKAIHTHPDAGVLVHCIAGQSRSPAVVATALACIDEMHFDEARDVIWKQRPQIGIHPALREMGLRYLDQDDRKPFTG